jgi:hypothetical protein
MSRLFDAWRAYSRALAKADSLGEWFERVLFESPIEDIASLVHEIGCETLASNAGEICDDQHGWPYEPLQHVLAHLVAPCYRFFDPGEIAIRVEGIKSWMQQHRSGPPTALICMAIDHFSSTDVRGGE